MGGGHPQKYSDFREVMERIDQHPNRRYFILKSIIIQNLYGVDIMEEAVEIAKLRLFLKLVAQVDDKRRIEPLPDIDFNIRAGNTLVGFATQDEVRRAMTTTSAGQGKLLFGEDQAALDEIERKAADIDRLFGLFRQQQTELGGEVRPEDKAELKRRLGELEDELNRLLAGQYGIDPAKVNQYAQWQKSHEPFHWFVEFYGVLKNGGFDVIIGNPPYVEYHKIKKEYRILNYITEQSNNLYAFTVERCSSLLRDKGYFSVIVPLSGFSTTRMIDYQDYLWERYETMYLSYFSADAHPSILFQGVKYRLCIIIGSPAENKSKVYSTDYLRWYAEARSYLFPLLRYQSVPYKEGFLRFAKTGTTIAIGVINKLLAKDKSIAAYLRESTSPGHITYHRSPVFWIRAMDFEPYFKSETRTRSLDHIRDLYFSTQTLASKSGAAISSSLFYIWFTVQGNCRNIAGNDIEQFPVGDLTAPQLDELEDKFSDFMSSIKDNSRRRRYEYKTGPVEYQEFYLSLSKDYVDEIDRVLALHYGFTDEELDFIINYDIKYCMGDDLFEDEEGDES